MSPWQFIKSPVGNLVVFVCFATVGGLLIHRSNARDQARGAQLSKVEVAPSSLLRESIVRGGQPLKVPPPISRASIEQRPVPKQPEVETSRPRAAREVQSAPPEKKPQVLPISLFAG